MSLDLQALRRRLRKQAPSIESLLLHLPDPEGDGPVVPDVPASSMYQARDEETLAADLIVRVGPGNAYLMEEHTLAHFRDEYYYSPLANRLNAPAWEAAGAKDAVEHAAEAVRDILAAPAEPCLTDEQSREVRDLLVRAEETLENLEVRI